MCVGVRYAFVDACVFVACVFVLPWAMCVCIFVGVHINVQCVCKCVYVCMRVCALCVLLTSLCKRTLHAVCMYLCYHVYECPLCMRMQICV